MPGEIFVAKGTDARIVNVDSACEHINYRAPIKFGGRVVTAATLFHVWVTLETRDGKRATGFGSMPLSNVWAWPTNAVASEQTLDAMRQFSEGCVAQARMCPDYGHPLDLTHALEADHAALATRIQTALRHAEGLPKLAQLVSASPVEAAIHDAYGLALGRNSYDILGEEFANADLSTFLGTDFAGEYLDRYTLRTPKPRMPLYHLVGALDPLTPSDVTQPVGDGLPEHLGAWIAADGLTHLKIKLNGDNLDWDVQRVAAVEAVAAETQARRGCAEWFYSLDFNEKCANVAYVLEFLARVKELSPAAWDRVQYIEQPTHRDLKSHPDNRMHAAAAIKPVVIDESLVDLESFELAREQGYSGVALKACKGQTGALLMGAAAQKYGLFLCVQDLTCPGASFLHSASLSARIPTVAGIEGNSREYCPAGNRGWDEQFPSMFRLQDGTVGTSALIGPGLCLGTQPRPTR